MPRSMLPKGLTIRGLEIFEALARTGSVAQTAEQTGLSQPAVSQHLRNLSDTLGVDLIEHGKRPMRLTPSGQVFLRRAEAALSQLRLAQSELSVMDLADLPALSIGVIDDFDNDLTPRLVTLLADSLTRCTFKLVTAPSHEIMAALVEHDLHLAISASAGPAQPGIVEYPLVRDPFILVASRGALDAQALPQALRELPFLRYEKTQLISRQIADHMGDLELTFEERFEIGSHLALMAMVARGIGWTITTPLGYMRAGRFHDKIEAFPLPFAPFARTISLFVRIDWSGTVPLDVAATLRRLLQAHMIAPALMRLPWLEGALRIVDD